MVIPVHRTGSELLQIPTLEHVQHLDQVNTARARRGHGIDVIAAICSVDRLTDGRFVIRQVFGSDEAAILRHETDDLFRDAAVVEHVRPIFGDLAQRSRQILLNVTFTDTYRHRILVQHHRRAGREHLEIGDGALIDTFLTGADNKALVGMLDGAFHNPFTRSAAEHLQRCFTCGG
ncbi:hypothetical protein BMS3Bbin04_02139 [bacterium BMS3Bbin04]|nr:hypothetical protein BMS3Bbin04_02139 [bacterium BMS3Bbin04]